MRVMFRIDGVLVPAATVAKAMIPGLISRIKIMASLDISEKRKPQDGRLAVILEGRRVDVRVVTLPLVKGEGVVMRILDAGAVVRNLESLGMQDEERERFEIAINKPYGAVLVTGPTGSGKSTTLYGALNVVNDGERSIITIEDPVESQINGIKQMQVANKAGVSFAVGLRAMLRADPDVIMVGEIRDRETAEIAIQAALTGHLVLSTLHTRDAPSAITRLLDMGVEPFMVAAAIDCVVAQRLARRLCDQCKHAGHAAGGRRLRATGCRASSSTSPPDASGASTAATAAASASTRSCRSPSRSARSCSTGPASTRSPPPPATRACARCARTASTRSASASPRWPRSAA